MKILSAEIFNFRNLQEKKLVFSPRVNLFLGRNGQGKTNLLEALNMMALGQSHRGGRAEDMIRFGADHLHLALNVAGESGEEVRYEYAIERGGERKFKIDGHVVARRADLVGKLATVFFWPASVDLVQGGPEVRRRFVDQGLSGIDRRYLTNLQTYLRALRQKARLLKEVRSNALPARKARAELVVWNQKMAHHATGICQARSSYAKHLSHYTATAYKDIAEEQQPMQFIYRPRLAAVKNNAPAEQMEREILAEFAYIMDDELRRGRPLSGPQWDDFEVRLGDLDLRAFGSQGETRTAAVSLIFAQSDVCYQMRNVRPVLFFDDIFSELDRERSRRLQHKAIQNHQVFIASARQGDVAGWRPEGLRVWIVDQGKLEHVA
jgi:DNA replication and repair protein RecF